MSSKSIANRSVRSVRWNIIASAIKIVTGFLQAVILARLLPVEIFGVYAAAHSAVILASGIAGFGTGPAFLNRTQYTEDWEHAANVHFTLKIPLTVIWAVLLLLVGRLFVDTSTTIWLAYVVSVFAQVIFNLSHTPRLILTRRVQHRLIAIIDIVSSTLSLIISVSLALAGAEIWALLATGLVSPIVHLIILYLFSPLWRPRLIWDYATVKYYFTYGGQIAIGQLIESALDRIDDLWTGYILGDTALGFYSRAYSFAQYPSFIVAMPINKVVLGTYAELKGQRARLSNVFQQVNSLLTRTGFYFTGVLALIAPEFIVLLLGDKWLPMLSVFRLMLLFSLLTPLKRTIDTLFMVNDRPRLLIKIRLIQLVFFVIGLSIITPIWNIEGVAVVVDIMIVMGIGLLLWNAREFVDFSLWKIFGIPGIAVFTAGIVTMLMITPQPGNYTWINLIAKSAVFSICYVIILLMIDRSELLALYRIVQRN